MQVVIVGNGAAALSALDRFRAADPLSPVTLVSAEPGLAYSRVLLPYFLRRRIPRQGVFIRGPRDYARLSARTLFGTSVAAVDGRRGRLELEDGRKLPFDRLLLATGARPFLPPVPGLAGPGVSHLWTLADAERLDPLLARGGHALVIGSGFVALQAAYAAHCRGLRVTVLEVMPRIVPTALDERGADLLHRRIEQTGVEIRTGAGVEAVERRAGGRLRVLVRGSAPLTVDLVVVGAGARPNVELLPESLRPAQGGIPVDESLQTGMEGIYAAGDVACGPSAFGEPHCSHALWPTAVEHGRIAGENLAGGRAAYRGSLNMNVTEIFGLTVASMGRFLQSAGVEVRTATPPEAGRYLKVLFREGVPEGAVAVGGAEEAAALGRLRPWMRHRRRLSDLDAVLEGRGTWLTGEAVRRKEERCAS